MATNNKPGNYNAVRRRLLQQGLIASSVLVTGPLLWGPRAQAQSDKNSILSYKISNIPNLHDTLHEIIVENDPHTRMRVPHGFSVREVARTGYPACPGSDYIWHGEPDGGACFAAGDGGWIYVSNAEIDARHQGGVGALRFDARGRLIDSYPIASGTTNNCAGGPTPWGTWLSCEEIPLGLVYECDPRGERPAVPVPAMGAFTHEAIAVDPVNKCIYQTEDMPDGCLYRFIPDDYPGNGRPDLRTGRLEVALIDGDDPHGSRPVRWARVPQPVPRLDGNRARRARPTRNQIPAAEHFNGGEGCWYHRGIVYFSTKGDNRVWALDTKRKLLDLIYDKQRDRAFDPGIGDVDNVTVSFAGDILVAEDGAEMRLVVVGPGAKPFELVNVLGHRQSEITGPAFSPDGSRLYFSSQRGATGNSRDGRTYEMRGPFFI